MKVAVTPLECRISFSLGPKVFRVGFSGLMRPGTFSCSGYVQKVFCTGAKCVILLPCGLFHDTHCTEFPMNSSTSPANIEDALRYQAETQFLRAQLNGDFLCNSLVVLQSCLIGGEPKIERMKTVINGLADYYRYAVAAQRDGTSPLAEEWEAVQGFLTVQKIRYAEGLQVESDLSEEALDFPVPRIFLQPLVDNAVKYGRKTGELPVKVRIRASCPEKKTLQVEVSNTGSWYEHDSMMQHVSVSLENLCRRLAELYPEKKHELTTANTDGWVTVKIRLSLS